MGKLLRQSFSKCNKLILWLPLRTSVNHFWCWRRWSATCSSYDIFGPYGLPIIASRTDGAQELSDRRRSRPRDPRRRTRPWMSVRLTCESWPVTTVMIPPTSSLYMLMWVEWTTWTWSETWLQQEVWANFDRTLQDRQIYAFFTQVGGMNFCGSPSPTAKWRQPPTWSRRTVTK